MKKVLSIAIFAVFASIFLSSCVDTSYPQITINPVSQHMKVGDTVDFVAQGGDGVYKFIFYTPRNYFGYPVDCACMFNIQITGNRARLTLLDPSCPGGIKSRVEITASSPNNKGWSGKALVVIDR